jgi:hypothetical protein
LKRKTDSPADAAYIDDMAAIPLFAHCWENRPTKAPRAKKIRFDLGSGLLIGGILDRAN